MQVTVESTGTLERRMRIELPAERISQEVATRLKSVGRTAKIKGFRPGKVPAKVVKQRYGKQIREEGFEVVITNRRDSRLIFYSVERADMP